MIDRNMFSRINNHQDDPIESLYLRAQNDSRPDVLNLGIGVYRDEQGNAPIFESVREAEQRVVHQRSSKGYMTPMGNPDYITESEKLLLGAEHRVIKDQRLISAQCPGAGAALRIGAELVKSLNPEAQVWFSDPVWQHQVGFFSSLGMPTQFYHYYDKVHQQIDFAAMLDSLSAIKPGDLVVIHGCCHNPTGADLSMEQWQRLTDLMIAKQAIPFVDVAYQGYGQSIEEDVLGVQHMASQMDNMLIALSASKSFAVYRDRVGMVSLINQSTDKDSLSRYLRDIIRGIYFMPPDHAAAVIADILTHEDLTRSWRAEIDMIRQRISRCRQALATAITNVDENRPTGHLTAERGMFSSFALDQRQLLELEQQHGIYLLPCANPVYQQQIDYGRINFAAMSEQYAGRIAHALCSV